MPKFSSSGPAAGAAARALAEQALVFVAGHDDLVSALLAASGARGDALREMVGRPEFPAFMLDFILASDERTRDFAAAAGLPAEEIGRARARLDAPGPA